jgi:cytochrome c oxidase cbb3-type subunit 1
MDRYVKNFIVMSIVYLSIASVVGILMIVDSEFMNLRFIHSHFMLLGWVSMMIYGVGYHILPRFSGKLIKSKVVAEAQFWLANAGLIGLVLFYTLEIHIPKVTIYRPLTVFSGILEVISVFLFFYNMLATLLSKEEGD